jgi:hypothetical protein
MDVKSEGAECSLHDNFHFYFLIRPVISLPHPLPLFCPGFARAFSIELGVIRQQSHSSIFHSCRESERQNRGGEITATKVHCKHGTLTWCKRPPNRMRDGLPLVHRLLMPIGVQKRSMHFPSRDVSRNIAHILKHKAEGQIILRPRLPWSFCPDAHIRTMAGLEDMPCDLGLLFGLPPESESQDGIDGRDNDSGHRCDRGDSSTVRIEPCQIHAQSTFVSIKAYSALSFFYPRVVHLFCQDMERGYELYNYC